MTSLPIPDWWELVLLTLAAFRVYRLIARDTITAPVRAALTYPDDATVELGERPSETQSSRPFDSDIGLTGKTLAVVGDDEQPKSWRVYLSTLIRCPWCAGFYVSVAWWAAWTEWPRPALFAAAPWAVSAAVALLSKLDV